MINYRKHIDDFFREKLGNYKETPPPEAWEELEGQLDGLTPSVPGSPYRIFWHIGIISLLLVLGISAGKKLVENSDNKPVMISSTTGQVIPNQNATPANTAGKQTEQAANTATTDNDKQVAGNNENVTGNKQGNNNDNTGTAVLAASNNNRHNRHHLASKMKSHPAPFTKEANWTGEKPQGETVYHNPNSNSETNNEENKATATSPGLALSTDPSQEDILPGTFKKDEKKEQKKGDQQGATPQHSKVGFNRFEAGVKGGYELGFIDGAAMKFVVSPYLQYNLSPKVAIMTQPAVKYANVSSRNLGEPQSYYDNNNINNQSYQTMLPPQHIGGSWDTFYTTTFKYTESHDSIVKSYKYGGTYFEFELPILFKYAITNKVSVYGGMNVVYSKFNGYTENTYVNKGITTSDSITVSGQQINPPSEFGYNIKGTPYSSYKAPYPTTATGKINIGYMAGFSYEYSKRWLADALIQQTPVNTNGGVNAAQSTTYFRLSIGYKLTK